MRTIKPVRLGVLHRVLELGRKPHLILSIFAGTPLGGAKEAITEVALWKLVEKSLGTGSILDEGYSKPAGEVVVHGTFHAPHGVPTPVSFAGLELVQDGKKTIDKRLAILGRREWRSGLPTEPAPIATLKLDWTSAFGGDDHPTNLVGRGMKPKDSKAPWLLPHIEDPKHLIRSPGDRPRPAGFGPIDLGSTERRELAGDYGGDYLETRFPGPAADMDPRFFHTAREDQRIQGFFQGGERLALVNMHEKEARIEGVLHPLRGRAFIERGEGAGLVEVPLRIDTLVVFPGDGMLVAVHRGVVAVDEDDASDVTCLVIAGEDPSMPRTVEHYGAVMKRRTDRERYGALWALQDEDLMPQREAGWGSARLPDDDMISMTKVDNILVKRQSIARERIRTEKRDEMARAGLDPDVYLPAAPAEEPPPDMEDVEGTIQFIEKAIAREAEEKEKAEVRKLALLEAARQEAKRHGGDWDAALEEAKKRHLGPPKSSIRDSLARLRANAELARNAGVDISDDLERSFEDPGFVRLLEEQEKQMLDTYRMSVAYRDAAPRLDDGASAEVRRRFADAREKTARPDDVDGTGADLSKMDLSGMNLSGGLLECANLTETVLDGANLENAVLARATLKGARFSGANLEGANLGDATFDDVQLMGARLHKAWFTKARIEKASFASAELHETMFLDATLGAVDFSGATFTNMAFYKLDLRGARFSRAVFKKAVFVECDLSGVDFSDATMEGTIWIKTRAEGVCLARAKMTQCAWPSEVPASRADLRGARIERCCFRGAELERADFTGASLVQCDFGNANLTEAILTEVDARASIFIRANLTRAKARGANFMDAFLSNAKLAGADFSKANLFRATLSRARGDDATRFTGANVENVLKEPLYEPKHTEAQRG